jgi:glutamate dehydrogenase/leucine dehydrogenase
MLKYPEMLDIAAEHISISESEYIKLKTPLANINVNITLTLESGESVLAPSYLTLMNEVGPGKGGLRIHKNVTAEEVQGLAGLMEIKCRITELPFAGAKSGICIDAEKLTLRDYQKIIFLWSETFKPILIPRNKKYYYITACDVNTRPWMMSLIVRHMGDYPCATSKDPLDGGIKGRPPATGFGVANITKYYIEKVLKESIKGKTIGIQGFGNVGSWTARYLYDMGAKITAITDYYGGVHDENGLNIPELLNYVNSSEHNSVTGFKGDINNEDLLAGSFDVLIPAALEDQITDLNANKVESKLIVCAANGPITLKAQNILSDKRIEIIPGIANAGGVIASNFELMSAGDPKVVRVEDVQEYINKKQISNFDAIIRVSKELNVNLFLAEIILAIQRRLEILRAIGF